MTWKSPCWESGNFHSLVLLVLELLSVFCPDYAENLPLQVLKAVMLFPTIERMAQSPQGKVMTPVLCHLRYVAYLPLFLLSLLPDTLKVSLIKLVLGGIRSLDLAVLQPTLGLLSGDCAGWLCFVLLLRLLVNLGEYKLILFKCITWIHFNKDKLT